MEADSAFVDERGETHREGTMRLATARDEIEPLRDVEVRANGAYLTVLLLARTLTRLGTITEIIPALVERLFAADFDHLQRLYELSHHYESGGKAGRSRWLGKRPAVRGSTMNPADHPHGGGEGKTGPGGNPKTPWGKPALGLRTRKVKKASDKLIIRRREKR